MHYPRVPAPSLILATCQPGEGSPGSQGSLWFRTLPYKGHPTPVFLPWKFHGQRSLASYSPWSHKESDMIKQAQTTLKKWKPHPSTWSRQKHRIDLWLLPFLHISYQICHWLLLHINYIQILPTSNHLHYIILIWATNIFYLNCFKFPNCSPHSIFNLAISFSWWCHFFV